MDTKKRWTKSGYRRERVLHYVRTDEREEAAQSAADQDVRACDAVGYDWLPEEPELPGKLRLGGEGTVARVIAAYDGFGGHLFTAEGVLPAAVARAMVSLWNAWGPEGYARKRLEGEHVTINPELKNTLLVEPWKEEACHG